MSICVEQVTEVIISEHGSNETMVDLMPILLAICPFQSIHRKSSQDGERLVELTKVAFADGWRAEVQLIRHCCSGAPATR